MIKIILCAFNESENLTNLIKSLLIELDSLQKKFEIIICLDCTTDNSVEIINNFNRNDCLKILPQQNKRGLGIAYKRVFLEIIKNSNADDLVISLDADNSHNPSQIQSMLAHFEKNSLDVLVASRFLNKSIVKAFPLRRKFISKTTSLFLQILFPIKNLYGKSVLDYTSGYRIYKVEKLQKLFLQQKENFINEPEFTYTCELLIKLSRIGCKIDEIPISYEYEKKIGKSKLRIWKNFYRLLIMTFVLLKS